jgi:sugar phosphate isomerase/epimerase
MKMLSDAGIQSIELCSPWYSEHNFGFGSLNKLTADYFTAHPNRFISMHLQDLDMNAPVPPPAQGSRAGRRPQTPIGKGSIDWVKTFRAAKTAGVQNYFIEMNEQLMRESVPYLKALTL